MAQPLRAGQRVMLWRDLPEDDLKAGALGVVALTDGDDCGVIFDQDQKSGYVRVKVVLDGTKYLIVDFCGPMKWI